MKYIKDKNFLRFFIPSLIGVILFVTPVHQDGNLTIPIAVLANLLLDMMGDASTMIICSLISISAVTTLVHKFVGIGFIKNNPKLDNLFTLTPFWFCVRMTGFVFAMQITEVNPPFAAAREPVCKSSL